MEQQAKISGIAYLMIFIAGFYANFAVLETSIDINSPLNTTVNFINNHSQFGYGLLGFIVMLTFDVFLVWSLFDLTKPISKKASYAASFFRMLHALFFSIALYRLWEIYQLTSHVVSFKTIPNNVAELLYGFDFFWTIGLLFFAVHLIVLGYLIMKSTYIPKTLGVLLLLSAMGYLIDGIAKFIMPNYIDYIDVFEVIVIMPTVIGEFSFTVWLLIKGFRKQSININPYYM